MSGAFLLVRHEDEDKYELISRHSITHGKSDVNSSITYRSKNGLIYSRIVACCGSKTACLAFLSNLGKAITEDAALLSMNSERPKRQRTLSPAPSFSSVFIANPSAGKTIRIKKEKLTPLELREQIDKKKPKGGRLGFIPILNSSPPRVSSPSSPIDSPSRRPSPAPPLSSGAVAPPLVAAAAASSVSTELAEVKASLDALHKVREVDRALLESISDRMLCSTGLRYSGPQFMDDEDVAHLSLHTMSDFAFVRDLFDTIADDEEEKKLEVSKRERFKQRWVEEQYRKFRHPNPHGFSSSWKEATRQFKKTLKRRAAVVQAREARMDAVQ